MKAYAAYYDNEIRMSSSSGGVFTLLASQFDAAYGVAMTEDCYECSFVRIERNTGDISPVRGSKYFQAKVGDAFEQVRNDLQAGKKVLFSGTGCQINGLALFLGKEYPNLFLLDVVCHGVPSPKLWRQYAEYQEKRYGKLESVNFRCKDNSWDGFGMKENKLFIPRNQDPYMFFFLNNMCLRPSCYDCHAKQYKKADMTIADFWGIEEVAPEMNDNKGTSLVITRTEKGQGLFDSIKDSLIWKEVSYDEGVRCNVSEYQSVSRPWQRDNFYQDMNRMSFRRLTNKYIYGPLWKRTGRKVKRFVKKIIGGGTAVRQRNNSDYGVLFTFER